jgi:RHS repeat-associated protein
VQVIDHTSVRRAGLTVAARALCISLALGLASVSLAARSQQPEVVGSASPPNGSYTQESVDLTVKTSAGDVTWRRTYNGSGWRFNRHWDGISASYKPLAAQAVGGGAAPAAGMLASGGEPGCWIWVDEDWQPGQEVYSATPDGFIRVPATAYQPFNVAQSQEARPIINDSFWIACGSGNGTQVFEGFRRISALYVGSEGSYVFKNRYTLRRITVTRLPYAAPIGLTPISDLSVDLRSTQTVEKGWRWQDRAGDWTEYDDSGRITRYGDRNDNVVWLQRDNLGRLIKVIDGGNAASVTTGRVVMSLHYNEDGFLIHVLDYPRDDNSLDLPPRVVTYAYNSNGTLASVTDARGFVTSYHYNLKPRLTGVTDAEGRQTHIEYESAESTTVTKIVAADTSETTYAFSFDESKKLFYSKMTGPATSAGRRVEDFTHDRSGDLVRYEVNGRTDVLIERDPVIRSETQTNARGFQTVLTRNEFELVTRVINPDGTQTSTEYESRFLNPVEYVDEGGFRTKLEYDARGNLQRLIEAAGTPEERVTQYQVDEYGRFTRVTRKGRTEANGTVTPDAVWQMTYDSTGQIRRVTDPEGHVRDYVFDRGGNLRQYTDPRGHISRYDVDAHGNLTQSTNPLGHQRRFVYDKVGNLTQMTDARAKTIQGAYDAMNRRNQVINRVGGVHRLQYNGQGMPIAETDEDNRSSHAEFDNFLRITRQVDAIGNVTEYSYNIPDGIGAGTLGALFDPTQIRYPTFTQRQRYDQRERPTNDTLLNPTSLGTEGLVSSAVYDARGNIVSETDANGKTRFFAYDALGRLIEFTDSLGNKTRAVYDARSNLIEVTDANGNANRFEFDRNNRVVKEILPLGQITTYGYDAAGNVSERTDPNGHRTAISYDDANRPVEVKHYRAGMLVRTTSTSYDEEDNVTAWSDTDTSRNLTVSAVISYDDEQRKTGETVTYPAGNTLSYSAAYSAAGYRTRLTWPDGTVLDYTYSDHGELESITIPGEGTLSVNQFKWFEPAKVTLPGGSTQERTLDGLLYLEQLRVRSPSQQAVLNLTNTFGKVQEIKASTRTDTAGNLSTTRASTFSYDDEIRLTRAVVNTGTPDTETFTLDALGNRIAHSRVTGAWTYDANNRLTQRGTGANATTYQYDEAGNLTRKTEPGNQVTQYGYDTSNRLIEVKDGAGNLIARYGYDPLDRRLWREQYRDRAGAPLAQARRTYYLYADEGLIAEAMQNITLNPDASITATGPVIISTQYGPRPEAEFTTGVLFVKTINSNGQTSFAYYHHDQIGTPLQATDRAGNVVWAAAYNVFGQAAVVTPQATADKPTITSTLRLPGQIEDEETGLHYNFRRYYDPSIGRYISQDPIGLAGGDNLYRYAEADPVNLTDPTGECPHCAAFVLCMAACGITTVAENAILGECNNWGSTAKNCAMGCAAGMGLGWLAGKAWGWGRRVWDRLPCAINSFPGDTLVHVKPGADSDLDAKTGKTALKRIDQLEVGDQVLAWAEWKDKGARSGTDERLSYEAVTDVFTSYREQTLVQISLDNGKTITATEGHPFRTSNGWRDAVLLVEGDRLLLKGSDQSSVDDISARIVDTRIESKVLPVFNLEVAKAHAYFVGEDGQLVHNTRGGPYRECNKGWAFAERIFDRITKGNWTQRGKTRVGQTADGKTANLHASESKATKGRPTIEVRAPDGTLTSKVRY